MAGISDLLTVNKLAGGSGPGQAAGAIGRINSAAGGIFNAVGAGSAVIDSVKSIFGVEAERQNRQNKSAINNLRSFLSKHDVMSNNLFYVTVTPPAILSGGADGQFAKELSLLCHQASLPGVSFGTGDVRRYGIGVTEKMPTFPIFTDLSLTFIGDGRGAVRNFFYNWMNGIIKFTDNPGGASSASHGAYEIAYKRDYAVRLEIVVLDRYNRKIFVTEINEAFPIALGDQTLSWNDNDSLMSVPVTFAYTNWKSRSIDVKSVVAGEPPSQGLLGSLLKIGTAIQTLATIKSPRSIGDVVNVTKNASSAINGLKGLF